MKQGKMRVLRIKSAGLQEVQKSWCRRLMPN